MTDAKLAMEISELMNTPAVRNHIQAKPGEIIGTPKGIVDLNGRKVESKSPMSPQLKKAYREVAQRAEIEINKWADKTIREIIPEEFHDRIEDFKSRTQLINKYGIEVFVEYIKDPFKEGFVKAYTKLGAHMAYMTVKGQQYASQLFVWEEE